MLGGLGLLQANEVGKPQRLQTVQWEREAAKLFGRRADRPEFRDQRRRMTYRRLFGLDIVSSWL